MPARLLLADAEDRLSTLPRALGDEAGSGARARPAPPPRWLADQSADANDLRRQRWAVVAVEGPHGDEALRAIAPLIQIRQEEQGTEARIFRVPPRMGGAEAEAWKAGPFTEAFGGVELERPRYLLLLGDLDGPSLALERTLASDGIPGRLAFAGPEGYAAYAARLTRPEAPRRPGALFCAVKDDEATALAEQALVGPAARAAAASPDRFHGEARVVEGRREALLEAARAPASVLLSASHGLGPPRRSRTWDPKALQGAMSFGPGEDPLTAEHVARGPFLPGGVWLYFACYGAGTPGESGYRPWLDGLVQRGLLSPGDAAAALRGLDPGGGFVAALPRAALANAEGPLGIIGHVDLAWSYSFQGTLTGRTADRSARFVEVIEDLLRGSRLGAAMLELRRWSAEVNRALTERLAESMGGPSPDLAALWMMRQDLQGFTLLGDPAARVASDFTSARSMFSGFSFGQRPAASGFGGFGGADLGRERERAVLAVLAGGALDAVARAEGISAERLRARVARYQEAGRRALADSD